MARKAAKRAANSNPAMRLANIPRMPRYNIRGSISDETVLTGNRRLTQAVTAGAGSTSVVLDINNVRTLDPISDVGSLYRQYKYLPGTAYVHVPAVSLSTSGTVAVAYIDNPEQMGIWFGTLTDAARYDFVTSIGNHKSYPIWKEFSYPLNAPARRLTFDVNANHPPPNTISVDEIERSYQGIICVVFAGVLPAEGAVARSYLHQRVMLRGLSGQQNT